jgi:isoleucyl-tRNA synthetase
VQVAALGRSARSKAQMKVRQPLARVLVKTRRPEERAALENPREQLLDELNVKDLAFFDDASAVLDYRVSLNPAKVGPKYGARMNELRTALAAFDPVEVARRVRANENVAVAGVELLPEELNVQTSDKKGYAVAEDAGLVVAVSTELTRELELEGMAREVVRHIQTMRKDANFNISDRIVTYYQNATGDFEAAIKKHGAYIRRETLSTRLVNAPFLVGAFAAVLELDKARGELAVSRTTRVAKKTRGVRKTKKIARGVKKTRG